MDKTTLDDNLNALNQISQLKLMHILQSIPGKKDIIIEQKLMKVFDCFIGVSELKNYGVDKIFKWYPGLKPFNSQRVFIISCNLKLCSQVFDQIKSENSQSPGLSQHIILTPFIPVAVHNLLEEYGLFGLVSMKPFLYEFLKVDGNVLSLEFPLFSDLYYHKDTNYLPSLAKSLWSLRMVLGLPKLTVSLGNYSKAIDKMINTFDKEFGCSDKKEVGALIIMDRGQDLATPLLTPVTYLGLLSEVINIKLGTAYLSKSHTKLDPSNDQVYEEVRDKHFSDAFATIRLKAKSLKAEQESTKSMELEEMKHYVQNTLHKTTRTKQQLEFHISAFEAAVNELASKFEELNSIQNFILDCNKKTECLEYILRTTDDHRSRSLKLFLLLSITSDGVSDSEIALMQKSHLHAHGYHYIPLFHKLESSGLLIKLESKVAADKMLKRFPNWTSKWMNNSKRLRLIPQENKDTFSKVDISPSSVYSGSFIPLIVQVMKIVNSQITDPKSFDELINVTGCTFSGIRGPLDPGMIVVCVVGGITYGEISACRLLAKNEGIQVLLVSDSIITGDAMIEALQRA